MSPGKQNDLVVMIVGATGVGKTALAIELASAIGGEIISADSRYLYRGMDIGTAKPSINERKGIPHHLIDSAAPDETWSLAVFLERTLQLIEEIREKQKVPVIVGGTGQYVRALTEGWRIPAHESNESLRRVLYEWGEEIGKEKLHRKLAILDTEAARIVDPSNVRRTIRALEVIFTTGEKFTSLRVKEGPAYDYWIIGLTMDRDRLYERIDARIEEMFQRGMIEEVKKLLERGFGQELPSMSAIGYLEVIRYINGEIDLETVKSFMRKRTRNFVRRQTNWFKPTDGSIHWYSMDGDPTLRIIDDLHHHMQLRG